MQESHDGYIIGSGFYSAYVDDYPPPHLRKDVLPERKFKQCNNRHYFALGIVCPFCGAEESPESQEGAIDFNQTMIECRKCGKYTPIRQRRCMHCGTDLFEPATQSEENVTIDGHIYKLKGDQTASLVCYSEDAYRLYNRYRNWIVEALDGERFHQQDCRFEGNESVFYIPRSIKHQGIVYLVTAIEKGAFAFCRVYSIIIPDSIENIKQDAFYQCDGLKTLIIPDSVKSLAMRAISGCKDLTSISWQGTTYEDDIDELFIFPDNKDKYAIVLNSGVDEMNPEGTNFPNPKLCLYGWYRFIHRRKLEDLKNQAKKEYWIATIGGNPVERSEWYQVMRLYIDRKTDDIISHKQCYKYGLLDLDNEIKAGFYKKDKLGYCHAFWAVKKALIKQDYGLIWYTPQEMEPDTQFD